MWFCIAMISRLILFTETVAVESDISTISWENAEYFN
jgi:hypothetical protein